MEENKIMLDLDELKFVRRVLEDLSPDIETHSWGPTYELSNRDKDKALTIIKRAIKELKK